MDLKRFMILLKISIFSGLLLPSFVGATAFALTSSTQLIEEHQDYNGKTVTFEGEAIGDVMIRGESAWIHLNDDPYGKNRSRELSGYNSGMAVWISADEAGKIETLGNYNNWGDLVRVVGTFNAACLEHGGDMDIHASSLSVIKPGEGIDHPIRAERIFWAAGLGFLSATLFLLNRRKARS
ncbi:MAG: hypothetical protein QMD53_01810 [Actinomycetota bacterium]|nr:hypothetical protein [Actinomycetota bacterium]